MFLRISVSVTGRWYYYSAQANAGLGILQPLWNMPDMLWNLVQIICVTSSYTGSFKAVDSGIQTEDRHMEGHRQLMVMYAVNCVLPMLAVIYFVEAVVFYC